MDEWARRATRLLRIEMERQDVTFKELSRRLEPLGVELGSAQLSNKINRGRFTLAFFLQCMRALNVDVVRLFDREVEVKSDRLVR